MRMPPKDAAAAKEYQRRRYLKNKEKMKAKARENSKRRYWESPEQARQRVRDRPAEMKRNRPVRERDRRQQHALKKYGLTSTSYDTMLVAQDGNCAICHLPPKPGSDLFIDHDHVSKHVRALLCARCNTFIGFVDTNPALLPRVIAYLKLHAT